MWQSASETMKRRLAALGAIHVDNIVVTHQGPVWATFVTTPRKLFSGKEDSLLGLFPPGGVRATDLDRIRGFGRAIADQLDVVPQSDRRSFLHGLEPVTVNQRYVFPEWVGWRMFYAWARAIQALEKCGSWARTVGVCCFVVFLGGLIVIGIPVGLLARILLHPLLKKRLAAYIERLKAPSGGKAKD
jgi:hypothetical protein